MAVEAKVKSERTTNSVGKYFKDIKAEFKKITWAKKEDVFKTTGVVLVTVVLFTAILWLYDSVFGWLLKTVLNNIK